MATYQFQTEVNQLLKLIIHSMYSNKDIFLREIISNASDALDKLKYLTVSDDAYKTIVFKPRIDITFDEKGQTLTVQDNGIGMSDTYLSDNLGTIAPRNESFLEKRVMSRQKIPTHRQFGVGFYSAFMLKAESLLYSQAGVCFQKSGTGEATDTIPMNRAVGR